MAVSFNMLYKKLNSMLLISRFLKNTIYLIKNTKWRISKLQLFNLNNHLSSFNYFRLKNEAGIQHTRKWTISGLTWLSLYSFFGSYFLEKFKKRYIFLINKCVISLQLKVFRYNVYLIISDGFNKKLYTYFTLKKTFPMERRKARMRMKNIKELCRSHLTNFLKLKKNKNFKYCIVILKSLHYRSTVIINILGQLNWKKLKLSILGIKIGNEKAHNGLRLPKRRRC